MSDLNQAKVSVIKHVDGGITSIEFKLEYPDKTTMSLTLFYLGMLRLSCWRRLAAGLHVFEREYVAQGGDITITCDDQLIRITTSPEEDYPATTLTFRSELVNEQLTKLLDEAVASGYSFDPELPYEKY